MLAVILQHHAAGHAADLAGAFGATFWWAVGFTALAAVPALLLPSVPAPAPEARRAPPGRARPAGTT